MGNQRERASFQKHELNVCPSVYFASILFKRRSHMRESPRLISAMLTVGVAHKANAAQFALEAVSVGWLERINRIGTLVNLESLGREHHFKCGLSFVAHVVANHRLHLSLGWLGVLHLVEDVRLISHRHRAHARLLCPKHRSRVQKWCLQALGGTTWQR